LQAILNAAVKCITTTHEGLERDELLTTDSRKLESACMSFLSRPVIIGREGARGRNRLAYLIATGAGAGFAPIAPGTFGALEGVAIYLLVSALPLAPGGQMALVLALGIFTFLIGWWSANRACAMLGVKDPGSVIIDEVSGQLLALVPVALAPSIPGVVVAFLLFRLFDIFKPYPIYKLEHLRAGLGVMSDDALAGVYTAALVYLSQRTSLL
jgi:phosphatidylglycerophosphatase A